MILAAQFLGRLHPLLVHLPIGILLLAALFEFLSVFKRYRYLRQSVQPTLLWGTISAVVAAVSGYLLAQEGGYDDRLLSMHQNAGIATAVFACLMLVIRRSVITYFREKEKRKFVRVFLFVPLIALISLTGHFGGSLTHGEDYLFAPANSDATATPKFTLQAGANLDSVVLYKDILQPILESRCYSCHSAAKQKGQLRLDETALILKGGKHGAVLTGVIADSASLYARLMLPLEDEKHMPPNEKPQLTSSEIALIHSWIAAGAPFEMPLGQFKESIKLKGYIKTLIENSGSTPLIPVNEVVAASKVAIDSLIAKKILILPVGLGTNYLAANFVNARVLGDKELSLLLPIKDQLLWLNLGRTKISDAGLATIGQLNKLTQLNLEYTAIHNEGLEHLKTLNSLKSLNLVGTLVDDDGLRKLTNLKSIEKVFLYQTKVSDVGIQKTLQQSPKLLLDTGGYVLPARVTDTLVFKSQKKK